MTDQRLKMSLKQAYEEEFSELQLKIRQEMVHVFSDEFENNMNSLIYGRGSLGLYGTKRRRYRFRYLLVAILLLVFAVTTAFAIKPIRGRLGKAFYTVFYNKTTIESIEEMYEEEDQQEIHWKEPRYIPEGYQIERKEKNEDVGLYSITWSNENEDMLSYIQGDAGSMSLSLTSNDQKPEDIIIGDKKAKLIIDDSGTRSIFYEENGILYSVSGHISKQEIIKIADSIQ